MLSPPQTLTLSGLPFPAHPSLQHPGTTHPFGTFKLGQRGACPASHTTFGVRLLWQSFPMDQDHQCRGWRQRFKPLPADRAPPMGCQAPGLSSSTGFPASFYGCSPIRANSPSPAMERCRYLGAPFVRGLILQGVKLGGGWGRCHSAHAAPTSRDRGS